MLNYFPIGCEPELHRCKWTSTFCIWLHVRVCFQMGVEDGWRGQAEEVMQHPTWYRDSFHILVNIKTDVAGASQPRN